jgi:hypothetical protein
VRSPILIACAVRRMLSAYEQDTVEHTKDFVACIGGSFSHETWNSNHGQQCWDTHNSSCFSNPSCHECMPIPETAPYDVDCSWIKDRKEVAGGTGIENGVGASEDEQYLSAFYCESRSQPSVAAVAVPTTCAPVLF